MWCETAQKECKYLGFVNNLNDQVLLARALEEKISPEFASVIGEVMDDWIAEPEWRECQEDFCSLVGMAIFGGISHEAMIRYRDLRTEE